MPKKSKSSKVLQDKIQKKLKKRFTTSDHHKALKARVDVLEKEFKALRKMLDEGARKASPVTKRRTVNKPAANKPAANKPAASRSAAKNTNDLQMIKGIGAVIEKKLQEYGIKSYAQIAAWSSAEIEDFSQRLNFKGRIERERWVEQAKELIAK
ncbi:MAG: hypothetical protein KUF77_12975 [Candidatus Thiodiazotropha sp. (ex Lucina aurantia)]|nr:hypothetical protein [Candidatus Thiodiazotropha sp. (ex Lucina pensylvanica)]MBT3023986.1 hypothetical protein [Candidatus Thiodiazotropha taylori]MBT3050926.1 hypothetical protein [Candidatus Thiodiazotropha sp. (ex Codakia orbicularis)]MBV2103930.1 hypothetical protein [Candidatus Thiodiazotropha sp. (ex Lucina aurantia)]MCG8097176.1 hypothetical protein [Candidatus Thiodiazotropha endolucinida]MCU7941833.1 hypothetical protein [Candidatus Thiodiazotropha sp. (ex Cardiolucina cf. quadrat